ncbi:MAG: minor capsid protein [Muribaculaceae bacterium]|nr:minor capsid protein [Muribaculaceae bacterium]
MGLSLLTPNGDIKPFNTFLNDVKAINDRYNHNYLRAEYQQAIAASQMAVRWHEFEKDGDRYDLQYRTANDSRVREEHAILHNTTLPASDPFWDSFLPPNGWGCRCTTVQVRKGKYPTSDPELAMKRGQNCTDGAKRKIFRFNPGKAMRLYPEQHPYFPKGCGSCPRKLNLAFDPKRQICIACAELSRLKRIIVNRLKYNRLKKDKNYRDVEFDEMTGGVKATHKGHSVQDADNTETFFGNMKPADLECECQNLLFKWGHTAVLRDEFANKRLGNTPPSLDIEIDGKIMDIRSITQGGLFGNALMAKNRQLANVKKKTGIISDSVCLHFHDPNMFSEEKLLHDAEWFKQTIQNVGSTQRIKHIYVVINGASELKIYDI